MSIGFERFALSGGNSECGHGLDDRACAPSLTLDAALFGQSIRYFDIEYGETFALVLRKRENGRLKVSNVWRRINLIKVGCKIT